jgi:hypothetical protein
VIQSFFEEKNIRLGEILAGLFIVISSVGLIISLKNTLQKIPYFPAFLFLTFTLAFHGAGLYSLRKWKLQTVSHVVLIISLLLVPLSFAAAIVFSQQQAGELPPLAPMFWFVLALGIAGGAWVTWSSSHELSPRTAAPWTAAILVASATQVLIDRLIDPGSGMWSLLGWGSLPTLACLAGIGGELFAVGRRKNFGLPHCRQMVLVAGTSLFAWVVAMVLLVSRVGPSNELFARLTPLFTLVSLALTACGVFWQQRTTAKSLAVWRTGATSLAIGSGAALLLWLVLAWPRPELLVLLALIDAVALAAIALAAYFPVLYAIAWLAASLGLLFLLHGIQGRWPAGGVAEDPLGLKLLTALWAGRSALFLLPSGLVATAMGWRLLLMRQRLAARSMLAAAGVLGLISLAIAGTTGFLPALAVSGDPSLATPVFVILAAAIYALATKLAGRVATNWRAAVLVALAMLWAGLVHALWKCEPIRGLLSSWHLLPDRPVLFATLFQSLACVGIAAAAVRSRMWAAPKQYQKYRGSVGWAWLVEPPIAMAIAAGVACLFWLGWLWWETLDEQVAGFWMLAVVVLTIAILLRDPRWMVGGQLWVQAAIAVSIILAMRDYSAGWIGLANAKHGSVQVIALALSAMVWRAFRRATHSQPVTRRLLNPFWGTFDRFLIPRAVLALLALALIHLLPEAGRELGFIPKYAVAAVPHFDLAFNPWVWSAAGILAVAVGWMIFSDRSLQAFGSAFILGMTAAAVGATGWLNEIAVASAARWLSAGCGLLLAAVFVVRESILKRLPYRMRFRDALCTRPRILPLTILAFALFLIPLLGFTITAVAQGTAGEELGGPIAESFFARIGMTANYALPLFAGVVVFLIFALRERAHVFAFGGWLVHQLAVNLALLLWVVHHPATPAAQIAALTLQANSLAAGGYALLWLGLTPWLSKDGNWRPQVPYETLRPKFLDVPWLVAIGLAITLVVWSAAAVMTAPWGTGRITFDAQLGTWMSYAAVVLAAVIGGARIGGRWNGLGHAAAGLIAGLLAIVACTLMAHYPATFANRFLAASWVVEGTLNVVLLWIFGRMRAIGEATPVSTRQSIANSLSPWCSGLLLLATSMLPFSIAAYDPPWRWLALVVAATLGLAANGIHRRRQWLAYVSTLIFVILSAEWVGWMSTSPGSHVYSALIWALMLAATTWLVVEVLFQRRTDQMFDPNWLPPPAHHVAMVAAWGLNLLRAAALILLIGLRWSPFRLDEFVAWPQWLPVAEVVLTLLLFAALTLDRTSRIAIPGMFASGLLMVPWVIEVGLFYFLPAEFERAAGLRATSYCLGFATFVLLASRTWQMGAWWSVFGERWGVSDPVGGLARANRWLPWVNFALALATSAWGVFLVLILEARELRLAAAFAPAVSAMGLMCLTQRPRREAMQYATLALFALAVVCFGWADLDPRHSADLWLERSIRSLLALGVVTFLYALAIPSWWWRTGDWPVVFRRSGGVAGVLAVAALAAVLALEFSLFEPGVGVPINVPQITIVAVVLVGLIAGLLALALRPENDPLQLTEDQRMFYVYAAEAVGVMLFAHLYLSRPAMFDTALRPYWPFIIVALAFGGVGIGEAFRRLKIRVLYEPLQRTSMFLPLVPAIGFWVVASRTEYSSVLFLVGLVYVALAYCRKSFAAGLAAAAAGNGALWALLARNEGLSFVVHPQFWLIPPALSVLVAAHLQRQRMGSEATAAIRYGALLVIYLSSSSEMFIRGIGESLWPPIVLALLSLAGVAAGIAFRIRAFLYLGTTFVVLSLVSMVWHAARAIEHVWPWWAFGIGTGILLLAMFGVYEKKKVEVQALLDKLRQWER